MVQLEIGLDRLEALFNKGELCAADVRCLNCTSKTCVWNLCLAVCARRMHCSLAGFACYPCCEQPGEELRKDTLIPIRLRHEHLKYL